MRFICTRRSVKCVALCKYVSAWICHDATNNVAPHRETRAHILPMGMIRIAGAKERIMRDIKLISRSPFDWRAHLNYFPLERVEHAVAVDYFVNNFTHVPMPYPFSL